MSVLVAVEIIENRPGSSATILCAFDHGIEREPPIKKTVVVPDFMKRQQAQEYVLNAISDRSKEVDRHIEFWRAKKEKRTHNNPKELWQQKEDERLHDKVTRGDIEKIINEAMK